ncbi:hypothetical protein ACJMK2_010053 [Sinanodonta woodiana]|uniref:Thioredoxin domain-containing protein n=1 Tax=Sinanodonta woodiana TaxID=1069815 RepID=A0ABD3VE52_SINWO
MEAKMLMLGLAVCLLLGNHVAALVQELDQRFLDQWKEGSWLVEFYAPWCGHCKKLEPIFQQVALALKHTEVKVAKLDCTQYSHVASEFDVRGFPTIKFFSNERNYTHRSDRTKDDILEFVHRVNGPAVRKLTSIGKFNDVASEHSDVAFFVYVSNQDPHADLFEKYSAVAEEKRVFTYFYAGEQKILPQEVKLTAVPTILVFKDRTYFEYEAPDSVATMSSVQSWVNGERYPAFPKISGGNINEMADLGKYLVIVVVEEVKERKTPSTR